MSEIIDARWKESSPNCYCNAYSFPHRAGQGKCTGLSWLRHHWYHNPHGACGTCHHRVFDTDGAGADASYCQLRYDGGPVACCPGFIQALANVRKEILARRAFQRKLKEKVK